MNVRIVPVICVLGLDIAASACVGYSVAVVLSTFKQSGLFSSVSESIVIYRRRLVCSIIPWTAERKLEQAPAARGIFGP